MPRPRAAIQGWGRRVSQNGPVAPDPQTPPLSALDPTPAASPPPRRRARALALPVAVGGAIAVVCVAFVVARMTDQWGEVRAQIADASWWWIAAALVCAAAAMTWIAGCWQRVLALLGPPPARGRTVAWYFAGEIGKYVPGGVWPVLGRGELARRGGVPRSTAYPSVGLSLAALYLAALALAAVLVPLDLATQASSGSSLLLLLLLPLGLLALHPRVLTWGRNLLVRMTGKGANIYIPPWKGTIGLIIAYLPAWLLIWAATWCTARALLPDPPILRIGIATTLSWVAGFAAVPVPAGAGVREAVFVASSGLPAGIGATIAIGSRLVFLLADVSGAAVSAPWHRATRAERR
jgi:glycosyltransferase 2 family protein